MIHERLVIPAAIRALHERFASVIEPPEYRALGYWNVFVDKRALLEIAHSLITEWGATFAMLVGSDERDRGKGFQLHHVFNLAGQYLGITSTVEEEHLGFPSITNQAPAANWAEREVKDLLGLRPIGHPDPRSLVLHEGWPAGVFPLRKDFQPPVLSPPLAMTDLMQVEGPGVYEVPVGPIHAGIIEPGHFRFSVDGEHIINLEARLFWTHRGVEKRAEGRSLAEGLLLAERICGACSFANSLAYVQAVEALAGTVIPERAAYLRVVGAELERLYNHVGDIAGALSDVAYSVGAAQALWLKERLHQFNEAFAGNRLLMGFNILGGVRPELTNELRQRLERDLVQWRTDLQRLMQLLLTDETVLERMETTGILKAQVARDLGVVGPAARASGIDQDVRRDHPYAAYPHLVMRVPTDPHGDALARVKIKSAEFLESISLIEQSLRLMPSTPLSTSLGYVPAGIPSLSATEAPRGEALHWIMVKDNGTIDRYKVRSASYMNWSALPQAVLGNILPDFPLINKSFNLCYACVDR